MGTGDNQEILKSLEDGQIDVSEALKKLDSIEGKDDSQAARRPRLWRLWWAFCFGGGIGLAVIAAGLATLGGWWWLAAAPTGVLALLFVALGVLSADAPWLQLHIETGSESWPKTIRIGLPLPIRPAAWVLRHWPGHRHALRDSALDELVLSLEESLSAGQPMVIEVHEGRGGERVRLHIG